MILDPQVMYLVSYMTLNRVEVEDDKEIIELGFEFQARDPIYVGLHRLHGLSLIAGLKDITDKMDEANDPTNVVHIQDPDRE